MRLLGGIALLFVSVTMLIPPILVIFPSLIQVLGLGLIGLSDTAWRALIICAGLGGAGIVGGIWIIK